MSKKAITTCRLVGAPGIGLPLRGSLAGAVLGLGLLFDPLATIGQELYGPPARPRVAARQPAAGAAQPAPLPPIAAPQTQPAANQAAEGAAAASDEQELSPETKAKVDSLILDIQETEADLKLELDKSKLIRTKVPLARASIVDPNIVELLQFTPQEFELIGRRRGTTTLTLWFGDQEPQMPVIRYQITVGRDPEALTERQIEYRALQKMVNETFPNSVVYLVPVADKLIVKGQARDGKEATEIMTLIGQGGVNQQGNFVFGLGPARGTAATVFPDEEQQITAANIVSLLEVPGEQQILLKVRIAELSRAALRDFGVNVNAIIEDQPFFASVLSGTPTVTAQFDDGNVNLLLKAFASNGISKILAEPNLVCMNGRSASFLAGGQFAVPTVVGVGGAQAATTQFQSFGTQLTFTPTLIDKDHIRLTVAPTFSGLGGPSVGGIPGLNTRTVTTTVDMREGQWMAIGGLLQEEQSSSIRRIPLIGDIPGLRILFNDKTTGKGETELIVLISPEIVHPLEPEELPPLLPGMEFTEPNPYHFYVNGDLAGNPHVHHRATVWPEYADQIYRARFGHAWYQKSEDYYFSGPHGFSD